METRGPRVQLSSWPQKFCVPFVTPGTLSHPDQQPPFLSLFGTRPSGLAKGTVKTAGFTRPSSHSQCVPLTDSKVPCAPASGFSSSLRTRELAAQSESFRSTSVPICASFPSWWTGSSLNQNARNGFDVSVATRPSSSDHMEPQSRLRRLECSSSTSGPIWTWFSRRS